MGLLLLLAAQRPFFPPSICPQEAPGCWRKPFSLLLLWIMVSVTARGLPQPAPQHSPGLVLRFVVCLKVVLTAAVSQGSQSYNPSALAWGEQAPFVWA